MVEEHPETTKRQDPTGSPQVLAVLPPAEVLAVLTGFDERPTAFLTDEVAREICGAVRDRQALPPESQRGARAEQIAFDFATHVVVGSDPWGTYFQPRLSATNLDGTGHYSPDIREVDAEILAYWAARARTAHHPVLVARYADLVWDLTLVVTQSKRGRDAIECVRLAIRAYIAASRLDDGAAWSSTRENLSRALKLAMSIGDSGCIAESVRAHFEYVERTIHDDKVGTYSYLFDNLLPPRGGPDLEPEQENAVVALFEAKLLNLTTPGSGYDLDPYSPKSVGLRLAEYYGRKGLQAERTRVIRLVAEAFEKRARLGDALAGLLFLEEARQHFNLAGLRMEADRVQLDAQMLGPEAEERLARSSVSLEIPSDEIERFLDAMTAGGVEHSLARLALRYVPDQAAIAQGAKDTARDHPVYDIFGARPMVLGNGRIEADIADRTGDPDGVMVHETAQALQLQAPWIAWILERLVRGGLTAECVIEFVLKCPLYSPDRHSLLHRGVVAHFAGDYVQAIHILVPQIEHMIVRLAPIGEKPSNKGFRTGRGVMQSKNLNDMLATGAWPVPGVHGENLRMYLLSVLAHPKGLNIRNAVCHGLWSDEHFTQYASERLLHVVLRLSMLRESDVTPENAARASSVLPPSAAPPHSGPPS